jgi:hypothetical protein
MKGVARSLCPPVIWNFVFDRRLRKVATIPSDELSVWMGYINPGMLDAGNAEMFSYCINNLPSNASIIEIGSFAGKSLNYIIHLLRKAGRGNKVFSVDAWNFENMRLGDKIGGVVPFEDYRAHVIETFRRNVTLFSGDHLPHHIELNSDSFFAAWVEKQTRSDFFGKNARLGGPIAFAYIDGDHTYDQSKRDFENIDRFLESGGFIIFDDSADGSGWGSMRTAQEAADRSDYELVAKNPNYCLRKRLSASPRSRH